MLRAAKFVTVLLAVIIASSIVASMWIRLPALWLTVPLPVWQVIDTIFKPHSQEEMGFTEFLLFWAESFIVLMLGIGVFFIVRILRHRIKISKSKGNRLSG